MFGEEEKEDRDISPHTHQVAAVESCFRRPAKVGKRESTVPKASWNRAKSM